MKGAVPWVTALLPCASTGAERGEKDEWKNLSSTTSALPTRIAQKYIYYKTIYSVPITDELLFKQTNTLSIC